MNQEKAGLSAVNEFAKYAKLQRKCNKLESILKDNSKFIVDFLSSYLFGDRSAFRDLLRYVDRRDSFAEMVVLIKIKVLFHLYKI